MGTLREELQAIYDNQGRLTPALVVQAAANTNHPLHTRFEWNNQVAGDAYRQLQASQLIRSVKISYARNEDTGHLRKVRAWMPVRTQTERVYEPAAKVALDPFQARLIRADMERDWRKLKERYEDFQGFWDMVRSEATPDEIKKIVA